MPRQPATEQLGLAAALEVRQCDEARVIGVVADEAAPEDDAAPSDS